MDVPLFEDRHLAVIAIVAEALAMLDQWPLYGYVDARLDHDYGLASEDVLADMPDGTLFGRQGYSAQSEVIATVPALARAPAVADDVERFLAAVRLAAETERQFVPPPLEPTQLLIPAEAVIAATMPGGVDIRALRRLRAITDAEGFAYFTGDPPTGEWALSIDTRIRRYRDLDGLNDYIARRPAPRPRVAQLPVTLAPRIFILMPFGEPWSDNVNDAIGLACAEVAATVEGLSWARADDIDEPGRITDQIIAAIETADLIIADVTGNNPNVLFELGYGDAVRKSIIVLNQDISATPFDIKDWRQIEYSIHALADAREQLVTFVRGAIRARLRA